MEAGEEPVELKLFEVESHNGGYRINAMSFHISAPEEHLLFIDENGEVCAMFREWSSVIEMKKGA